MRRICIGSAGKVANPIVDTQKIDNRITTLEARWKRIISGSASLAVTMNNWRQLKPWGRRFYATVEMSYEKRPFIPRRALMYVPGSDEKKLAKVFSLKADCIVLDCEDGVALSKKAEARNLAVKFVNQLAPLANCKELGIRVNSATSGLLAEDLRALSHVEPHKLRAIMLPKVDSIEDLHTFSQLAAAEMSSVLTTLKTNPTRLVIWIESASALLQMSQILAAAQNLHHQMPFWLDGAVFGSDDYCADVGATRSDSGSELLYARQQFVSICKAYRIQAIDAVYINFKDLEGLRQQSEEGQKWGFTGKQVIHPSQIPVVQDCFLPSKAKLEWAEQLVKEFQLHQQSGKGAFTFRGAMIDMPLLLQAQNIIQLVESCRSVAKL